MARTDLILHLLDKALHYLLGLPVSVILVCFLKCLSYLHRFFWG